MIKTKAFSSASALASHFSKPENALHRLVGVANDFSVTPPALTAVFETPDKTMVEDTLKEERLEAFATAVTRLLSAGETTKRKMAFPDWMISRGNCVPASRVTTALSNLTCFRTFTRAAIRAYVETNAAEAGFNYTKSGLASGRNDFLSERY